MIVLSGCGTAGTLSREVADLQGRVQEAAEGVSSSPRVLETTGARAGNGAATEAARAELSTIDVKGRAPKTGYSRDQFGQAWADVDRNGCDTRNDILRRDLTGVSFAQGNCKVVSGTLNDPYTGKAIDFVRGAKTSTAVQIDHLVPLSEAWQKGAQQWDAKTRLAFANDPVNLKAVDGPSNSAKGDKDLATWLPPNRGSWCAYVADIVHVKAKYGVWMTRAEHARAGEILATC